MELPSYSPLEGSAWVNTEIGLMEEIIEASKCGHDDECGFGTDQGPRASSRPTPLYPG
jgi:hypothetical protein